MIIELAGHFFRSVSSVSSISYSSGFSVETESRIGRRVFTARRKFYAMYHSMWSISNHRYIHIHRLQITGPTYVLVDTAKPPAGTLSLFNLYVALSRSSGRGTICLLRDFDDTLSWKVTIWYCWQTMKAGGVECKDSEMVGRDAVAYGCGFRRFASRVQYVFGL